MFGLTSPRRFFLYREATDMRKSFDGLSGVVTSALGSDPLSGDGYLFLNRRRTMMKLLIWQARGFAIYYKRLERGTFELPLLDENADTVELSWDELVMLVEGVELGSVRRRRRYHHSRDGIRAA